MSKKRELKNAIAEIELEMEALEKKLFRSQTVVLRAIIDGVELDQTEVEYFKLYSSLNILLGKRSLQRIIP